MSDTTPPDDFDWVTARHDCSVDRTFEALKEKVRSDIRTCNDRHILGHANPKLVDKGNQFNALISIRGGEQGTVFEKKGDVIEIEKFKNTSTSLGKYSAHPFLHEDGSCRFEIKESDETEHKALQLWQVSRLALEDLLFKKISG